MASTYLVECVVCGNTAQTKHPAKYCSQECRNKRPRPNRKHSNSGKHSFKEKTCKACSSVFIARGDNDRIFCSDACNADWRRITSKPPSFRILMRKPVVKSTPSLECVSCGGARTPKPYDRKLCDECREANRLQTKERAKQTFKASGRKAAQRKARKLRLRGVSVESVNPLTVLERDKWTCQLCGVKTPKRLRGTYDDRAPEVDHIIPIAQGGEHSYRNTQCACRKCNLMKSGTAMGQMRLFG